MSVLLCQDVVRGLEQCLAYSTCMRRDCQLLFFRTPNHPLAVTGWSQMEANHYLGFPQTQLQQMEQLFASGHHNQIFFFSEMEYRVECAPGMVWRGTA